MSTWATTLASFEAAFRFGGFLPAGTDGWEVGAGHYEQLSPAQFPHVFAYGYSEEHSPIDESHNQKEIRKSFVLELWVREFTLASLVATLEGIVTLIYQVAPETLAVDSFRCVTLVTVEHRTKPYKAALFAIETVEVSL